MSYDFNADEIFAIAEKIEENGAEFYRRAAEAISCEDTKKLLMGLANMEDDHLKLFHTMRKQLPEKDKQSTVFDPEGDAARYLQSFADIRVFDKRHDDPSELVDPDSCSDKDIIDVLKFATDREKDSIVFYLGMKDLVPDEKGKKDIDAIIREEMSHIRTLNRQLQDVRRRSGL
ncbi:MAG: ferritin-like domain-containing protein [Desulfatibacillaceae bacterium]